MISNKQAPASSPPKPNEGHDKKNKPTLRGLQACADYVKTSLAKSHHFLPDGVLEDVQTFIKDKYLPGLRKDFEMVEHISKLGDEGFIPKPLRWSEIQLEVSDSVKGTTEYKSYKDEANSIMEQAKKDIRKVFKNARIFERRCHAKEANKEMINYLLLLAFAAVDHLNPPAEDELHILADKKQFISLTYDVFHNEKEIQVGAEPMSAIETQSLLREVTEKPFAPGDTGISTYQEAKEIMVAFTKVFLAARKGFQEGWDSHLKAVRYAREKERVTAGTATADAMYAATTAANVADANLVAIPNSGQLSIESLQSIADALKANNMLDSKPAAKPAAKKVLKEQRGAMGSASLKNKRSQQPASPPSDNVEHVQKKPKARGRSKSQGQRKEAAVSDNGGGQGSTAGKRNTKNKKNAKKGN